MLKKSSIFLIIMMLLICVYFVNKKPVFIDYSNTFTLYTNSNSSNCSFKSVDRLEYLFSINVFGEGCCINKDEFNLEEFLDDFSAKVLLVEQTDSTISYYAYSKKIKYLQVIKGLKINLHVAISGDMVYLGSPVIYGSF